MRVDSIDLGDRRTVLGLAAIVLLIFAVWRFTPGGLSILRSGISLRGLGLEAYDSVGVFLTDQSYARAYWGIIVYRDGSWIRARSPDQYASPQARIYASTRTAASLLGVEADPDRLMAHANRNTASTAETLLRNMRSTGIRVEPAALAQSLGKNQQAERGALIGTGGSQV